MSILAHDNSECVSWRQYVCKHTDLHGLRTYPEERVRNYVSAVPAVNLSMLTRAVRSVDHQFSKKQRGQLRADAAGSSDH